jgi:hypothetical protein
MNATPADLYKSLFAGNRLTLHVADRRAYESLRVALHKLHQTPKMILEVTDLSLCARFDEVVSHAIFWLGAPTRAPRRGGIEIVSIETLNAESSTE